MIMMLHNTNIIVMPWKVYYFTYTYTLAALNQITMVLISHNTANFELGILSMVDEILMWKFGSLKNPRKGDHVSSNSSSKWCIKMFWFSLVKNKLWSTSSILSRRDCPLLRIWFMTIRRSKVVTQADNNTVYQCV